MANYKRKRDGLTASEDGKATLTVGDTDAKRPASRFLHIGITGSPVITDQTVVLLTCHRSHLSDVLTRYGEGMGLSQLHRPSFPEQVGFVQLP